LCQLKLKLQVQRQLVPVLQQLGQLQELVSQRQQGQLVLEGE
jgi:hypothetical protein